LITYNIKSYFNAVIFSHDIMNPTMVR